jgi:hypothetical protein
MKPHPNLNEDFRFRLQLTVSVMVAECVNDPEVPVMVIV